MMNSIHLRNFKCFAEQEISLAPLTILAGANGAGKSSVIQALLLMKCASEVNASQRREVPLNGAYLLRLGTASKVLSSHAVSDEITLCIHHTWGEKCECIFEMDFVHSPSVLKIRSAAFSTMFLQNFRYLNAERIGPRRASEMNETTEVEVGCQGEFTNYALYQADLMQRRVHPELEITSAPKTFSKQVEAWLQTVIPHIQFAVESFLEVNMVTLKYKNHKDTDFYIPPATGFGITYTLPIIVAGLLASTEPYSVFVVENPEAHLHPFGQSRIGAFLAMLASIGVQVIVETHSEHVVNGARLQLAKMEQANKILINFFYEKDRRVDVQSITANSFGELSAWPIGFFDQQQTDLRELLRLKRK